MQNILEDASDAVAMPQQHSGRVSSMFRDYRNNFGLFWRVMFPLIIVNLLLYMGMFLFSTLMSPEGQWTISTERGLFAYTSSSQSAQRVGVAWGFSFSPAHIGLLWLAMCPLVFAIVQHRNGMDLTFKAVWQRTLRKTVPILGAAFFIGVLCFGFPVILGFLAFEMFFKELVQSNAPTLVFVFSCIAAAWFVLAAYFVLKWSLYNQGIMIENLSAIGALRRSSKLVRGSTWWKFLGIYLLLTWALTALTAPLLGLTMALLSFAAPEFTPMREALLSERFISLLFFGSMKITLENVPTLWTIGVLSGVSTLVCGAFAPVWASLTTQLYMEQADKHAQQVST